MIGVLTLILMLTIELGLAMHVRLMVTGAAREGARRAAIDGGDTASARQSIERYLALWGINPGSTEVSISPGTASYGTQVTVCVAVEYPWRSPLIRQIFGQGVTIRGEAVSRSEKVRTGT